VKKKDLVDKVAESAELSKKSAEDAVNAVLEAVSKELAQGGTVVLTGFGTFSTKKRGEREGRNPKTGEPIQIPSAIVPKFTAGKTLKDAVNGK
jgi:DNA-binding protein HU-beta